MSYLLEYLNHKLQFLISNNGESVFNLLQEDINGDNITSFLDIGGGTGIIANRLKKSLLHPTCRYIVFDNNRNCLRIGRNIYRNLTFTAGEGEHLPFKDYSFDFILSSLCFHHLNKSQKVKVCEEVKKKLQRTGIFVLLDKAKPELKLKNIVKLFFYVIDRGRYIGNFQEYCDIVEQHFQDYKITKAYIEGKLGNIMYFKITREDDSTKNEAFTPKI